ncbi:uncharacterized protein LOC143042962 [Mytilus galloprovincialis]|uniref:uncharacterized protein LOC143042962 n=1 Tax=Mytilus galloprovincialis TaxID=29158 RepID=UPI003F7B82D9
MAQIQKDYEQFTCDVKNLSETLKNVLHEVTDKKINHASDYLVLENVHWNHNLAKVETLLQEHTFMCTKLENILNESHNVTFYLNHSELIQEFTAADEIPVFEEPTRMIGLNVGEFIENVLEMIKSKYSISYMTEELTRYEVETKTLNEQISNDNERYQKEIDQLKDILTKEQASRDELAKALSNERDLYEKGKKQYQKEKNNLHDALTGKQAEIDLMNASWTIERRLFEREKEQFNRQIRKDKEKYQKDTENLNAKLTRKQAEMDEMNAFYRMEKELYETENKKVFEQMKSDQERFQEETENLHDTLVRKQTEFDEWNIKHGETRINEMEQTIDRLEAELRNCLNSTEPDLDSQLLEEDEDTKEISTQAEKLYRCRYCKEEKVLPKG